MIQARSNSQSYKDNINTVLGLTQIRDVQTVVTRSALGSAHLSGFDHNQDQGRIQPSTHTSFNNAFVHFPTIISLILLQHPTKPEEAGRGGYESEEEADKYKRKIRLVSRVGR